MDTTSDTTNPLTLVIGATGNVGRHVVRTLAGRGLPVRALARDPERARAAMPAGVDVVAGDLTRPETLPPALAGVGRVFLLWPSFAPDHLPEVAAALAAAPRHVVYLSAQNVSDDRPVAENGIWGAVEDALRRSGVSWTMLRPGGFATNALDWATQAHTGVIRAPYGEAGRSLVHERDLADAAVAALTDPGRHAGVAHVLTGPETITQAEQARLIGEAIGRPVRWDEQPPDEALAEFTERFGDAEFASAGMAYWATLVDQPEPVLDTVEQITGRPARRFRDWAAEHAADFLPAAGVRSLADQYVALMRAGRLDALDALMSPDLVRVAPMETGGEPVERRGMAEVVENADRLLADVEIHAVDVDGPFLATGRFAVRFRFDQTHTPTGARTSTTKLSLYTVADGRIVREEVFYYDAPQAVQ